MTNQNVIEFLERKKKGRIRATLNTMTAQSPPSKSALTGRRVALTASTFLETICRGSRAVTSAASADAS